MSLNAGTKMASSPYYNVFRDGFLKLGNEIDGTFDGNPVEQYGDTLVNDLFSLNAEDIETEAAVVTTVWMSCVHQLFQVMIECQAQDVSKGMTALDKAIALWVGADQKRGGNEQGHLLYELAESAGERFGQDDGVTIVNKQLIQRFNSIQSDFSQQCQGDQEGYRSIRATIRRMIGLMTVPLVQNLIHHSQTVRTSGQTSQYVKLYALSILPRLAICDAFSHDELLRLNVLIDLYPDDVSTSIEALQGVYHCLEISCEDVGSYLGGLVPECERNSKQAVTAPGYWTDRVDVMGPAALERDIRAIDVFLKYGAYGAAEDWYIYGWNSNVTLQSLAKNQIIPALTIGDSYIDIFQEYYEDINFADTIITNAINQASPYTGASKEQVQKIITGLLKHVVVFISSVSSLQYSIEQCDTNQADSLSSWDTGALLYLGSMEGPEIETTDFLGEFLYSTAKELCGGFRTCAEEAVGNSSFPVANINYKVIDALKEGSADISAGSCADAEEALNNIIIPSMIVPLIQGTVKYASINAGLSPGTSDVSLAIGDTFSKGILPIIQRSNAASAVTIHSNMEFQLSTKPVADKFQAVADALRVALIGMKTSCVDIGHYDGEPTDGSLCEKDGNLPAPTPMPLPTAPSAPTLPDSNLAWGRYSFKSNEAVNDANFALDVRDMWWESDAADSLYDMGKNVKQGLMNRPDVTSLSDLSREMVNAMRMDPMYNIYKYSLYDADDLGESSGTSFSFGDDIVVEALLNGQSNQLAAQAAVVLNVWHIIVHRLYESDRACDSVGADPVSFLDSAVALWIGAEQDEASFDTGWMIYQLAEETSNAFGLGETEAKLNSALMRRFNELQASAEACDSKDGRLDFYFLVQEQVQELSKVLALAFLSVIYTGDKNMIELYAAAILPQAVACDEVMGAMLESVFVSDFSEDEITNEVLDTLASFLRCQRVTADDLEVGDELEQSLSDLLLSLRSRLNTFTEISEFTPLAGYQPLSDVSEVARMDLDVQHIRIMLAAEAYEAARDIFKLGRNAHSRYAFRFLSFQSTLDDARHNMSDVYEVYSEYWDSETFASHLMKDVIDETGAYESVSRKQRTELGFRILQGMVSYIGIHANMLNATSSCFEAQYEDAVFKWDSVAALFVGSGEGVLAGGRKTPGGAFLYALSEEICNDFGLRKTEEETVENQNILLQLSLGRDAIKDGNCEYLRRLVRDEVTPRFTSLFVEGFVAFAIRSQLDTETRIDEPTVGAHVFADVLIPLIAMVNSGVAALLEEAYGQVGSASAEVTFDAMMQRLAPTLRGIGVDCQDISFPQYSLCLDDGSGTDGVVGNVPDQAPLPATPTVLGDGLYVTTTFVQDRANIAKDVAEIVNELTANNLNLAMVIYQDGKYSTVYDENGEAESKRSLKSFSVEETKEMLDEPLFNMFTYALRDNGEKFMSRDVREYADSLVEYSFTIATGESIMLPVEAMLALNLWMHLAHSLYETLKHCKNKEISGADGIHSMDIAVAYWIGDGQITGSGDDGHLFYAMAERMGEIFHTDSEGESRTNSNILQLFNEAKQEISKPEACSESPSSYLPVAQIVNNILSLMAVPLIQNLIHALHLDDKARVKIYAHSVVPLVAGCGNGPFEYLKEKLLTASYETIEIDEIIGTIRSMYPCLGLSCKDIGVHTSEMAAGAKKCQDPDPLASMAGYTPTSDVREFSRLDLDMKQLDILLTMKAFTAAENLYTYGKHVGDLNVGSMSLSHLATTPDRKVVPEFDVFVHYYKKQYEEPHMYADHIIRAALQNSNDQWSDAQRRIIVLRSAEAMVMYFGALHYLYLAVSECQVSPPVSRAEGFSENWDRGAALLIGSLEGTQKNGTKEGYMFYELSQQHCEAFGTCSQIDSAVTINDDLISLLYMGRGAALSNSCSSLQKAAGEIAGLLVIPIIQGALHSATQLSVPTSSEHDLARAEGYVFSRAILPLVASASAGAAKTIDEYLGFPGPSSTQKTSSAVFSAFADVYVKMGVNCKVIGTIDGNNPCDGVVEDTGADLVWIILGSLLGVCILSLVGFLYRRRRGKRNSRLPENNPRFIVPVNGELNYFDEYESNDLNHSMNLLEQAFSASRTTPHSSASTLIYEDVVYDASAEDDFDEIQSLKDSMESRDYDII